MKTSNPGTNNDQYLEARLNQMNAGRVRVLDLDFFVSGKVLTLIAGKDQLNQITKRVWMQNRVWAFDDVYTADLATTGLGGLVDGITLAKNTRYLVWLIGKTGNVGTQGLAITRKPLSTWTAVGGGGVQGTTVTFLVGGTGTNNAYQFSIGARVIVRSLDGAAPNYEWNHGTVTAISSTTELVVALDAGLLGASDVSPRTTNEIEQVSNFRPWDGLDSYTNFNDTYRLLGEGLTDSGNDWVWTRRTTDEWAQYNIAYPAVFPEGGSGSTDYDFWRYLPLWSNRVSCQGYLSHDFQVASLAWYPREQTTTSYLIFKVVTENPFGAVEGLSSNTFGEAPLMNNRHRFTSTVEIAGAGTLSYYPTILAAQDGGLRE